MQPTAYLFFDGNCAEAMRFYEKTLGGKLQMMTYADVPEAAPPNVDRSKVMHARLELEDGALMASDDASGAPYKGMSGFRVSIDCDSAADAHRLLDALAAGGKVFIPMAKTFWSEAFGMTADRFGTPWMVGVRTKS